MKTFLIADNFVEIQVPCKFKYIAAPLKKKKTSESMIKIYRIEKSNAMTFTIQKSVQWSLAWKEASTHSIYWSRRKFLRRVSKCYIKNIYVFSWRAQGNHCFSPWYPRIFKKLILAVPWVVDPRELLFTFPRCGSCRVHPTRHSSGFIERWSSCWGGNGTEVQAGLHLGNLAQACNHRVKFTGFPLCGVA